MRGKSHDWASADLFLSPSRAAARGSPWLLGATHPSPLAWSSGGTAAAGAAPGPSPQLSPAEGGGGCLMSATAQPWQVQDGRCRPEQTVSEVLSSSATTSTSLAVAANQPLQPHQISPAGERSPGYWAPSVACFWLPADPASINGNLSPKPRSVAMGDCSFYGISLAQEPGHQY